MVELEVDYIMDKFSLNNDFYFYFIFIIVLGFKIWDIKYFIFFF